jgi:hypothetical protein
MATVTGPLFRSLTLSERRIPAQLRHSEAVNKETRHRPGSCARQDGGGVLTAPISYPRPLIMHRPGRTPGAPAANILRWARRLWPINGACWPHGNRYCCSGSWDCSAGKRGPIPVFWSASPIAVGRAEVLRVVVPGTAAENPTRGDNAGMTAAHIKAWRRKQAERIRGCDHHHFRTCHESEHDRPKKSNRLRRCQLRA